MSCLEAEWELLCKSVVRLLKESCLLATLERKAESSSDKAMSNSSLDNHQLRSQLPPALPSLLTGSLKAHQ